MVIDTTPHGVRDAIDTPVHSTDHLQCPQFDQDTTGAAARHRECRQFSWNNSDSDSEVVPDSDNGADWFWNVVESCQINSDRKTR